MRNNKIIEQIENEQMKDSVPEFRAGDTVSVRVVVREGSRDRLQAFEGAVIAKQNRGLNSSFTVRKTIAWCGSRTNVSNAQSGD